MEEQKKYWSIVDLAIDLYTKDPLTPTCEFIREVQKHFPRSRINIYSASYYRRYLREQGYDIPLQKGRY